MFVAGWAGSCLASMGAWLGCSAVSCFGNQVMQTSARLAYCVLFALALALTWIMRDFGKPMLEKIPCALRDVNQVPTRWQRHR